MKPLWRKCRLTFPAINFWVIGLRHNQTETRAGLVLMSPFGTYRRCRQRADTSAVEGIADARPTWSDGLSLPQSRQTSALPPGEWHHTCFSGDGPKRLDAHPFIVPRVRKYLEQELHLDEPARMKWLTHWLDLGSHAIEDVLARDPRTGRFCCGDRPTIADICLVAHLTSANMLCDSDSAPYPTARRILDACMQIEAFALEHPLRQAGAQTTAPL